MKNIGYCCFVNKSWMPLVEVLINRLSLVSKYKLELFTINFDYEPIQDNVICKRIDIFPENFTNICYCKLISAYRSSFDFALIMDGDMIPLKNIDDLLEENFNLYYDCEYPVTSKLPDNVWEYPKLKRDIEILKRDYCFDVVMPYRYASYFFGKNSKPFFKEAIEMTKNNSPFFGVDETILNVLLNKHKFTKHLDYNYLPYYSGYESIVNNTYNDDVFYKKEYLEKGCVLRPYILHGCKDVDRAIAVSSYLKEKEG